MSIGRGVLATHSAAALRWWFPPIARGRVAALRAVVYGFLFYDVLVVTSWAADRGALPRELYRPLFIARHLQLPAPGPRLVPVVMVALLACAGVAATGRLPRLSGVVVLALYVQWMIVAFSYGKVDHDRFALLVALAVLPTVGAVRWGDRRHDEAAGWAVRCIQVAVVLTYLLAALAKFRFGGLAWLGGATLMRAVLRRGTVLAEPLETLPWVLRGAQWAIVAFELASPLLLARGRLGRAFVVGALCFHLATYAFLRLSFLPHVICLLAFAPLERIELRAGRRSPALSEGS